METRITTTAVLGGQFTEAIQGHIKIQPLVAHRTKAVYLA